MTQNLFFGLALALLVLSSLITFALTPWAIKFALKKGLVDQPGARRVHTRPTPRIGGLAIVASFSSVLLLTYWFFKVYFGLEVWEPNLVYGLILSSIVACFVGLVDDLQGISPWSKLLGQTVAATLFVVFIGPPDKVLGFDVPDSIGLIIGVAWLIATINAFNLIDGIDGLATALGIMGQLAVFGVLLTRQNYSEAMLISIGMGALLGFYPWNRSPARIFLGDCGSNFCGFLVGAFALFSSAKSQVIGGISLAIVVACIPLFDMLLAIWRRLARHLTRTVKGEDLPAGIMLGDLEHLHHRLMARGLSANEVVSTLVLAHGVIILAGLISVQLTTFWYFVIVSVTIIGVSLFLRFVPAHEVQATLELANLLVGKPRSRLLSAFLYLSLDFVACLIAWFACRIATAGPNGLLSLAEILIGLRVAGISVVFASLIEVAFFSLGTLAPLFGALIGYAFAHQYIFIEGVWYFVLATLLMTLTRTGVRVVRQLSLQDPGGFERKGYYRSLLKSHST